MIGGLLVLVLGPGGAAWAAVKVSLNGARKDISDTKTTCERMDAKLGAHGERLARVETRVEAVDERVGKLEDAA